MKYLKVKDLIEELQKYNGEAIVIVTDEGKDHQYGIRDDQISIHQNAYFGNDYECEQYFDIWDNETENYKEGIEFLNLGYF